MYNQGNAPQGGGGMPTGEGSQSAVGATQELAQGSQIGQPQQQSAQPGGAIL